MVRPLDVEFLEGLINYLAYKHAHISGKVEKRVMNILRDNFEKSKYRDTVINLDSKVFSEKAVLNPPPEQKPLLKSIVLPIVGEKEKEIRRSGMNLTEVEKYKSLFMQIINGLSSKECKILFIGHRRPLDYVNIINENIQEFNSIILSARGAFIAYMFFLFKDIIKILEGNWKCRIGNINIAGAWKFADGEEVNCSWILLMKKEKFPEAFSDKEILTLDGQ